MIGRIGLHRRQFPDLRVSGANFADSRKITDANPQQAEYLWGRRVLFDYRNRDGMLSRDEVRDGREFSRADGNRDGRVSYDEFANSQVARRTRY